MAYLQGEKDLLKNMDPEVSEPVDAGDVSSYSDFDTHFRNVHLCPLMRATGAIMRMTSYLLQFSRSVMSASLLPHGLQHARLSCPSLTPGACSNSCPSNW